MLDFQICGMRHWSYTVLCSIYVADYSWFREFISWYIEAVNYKWADEVVCCATVQQCVDIRMKLRGFDKNRCFDLAFFGNEYSLGKESPQHGCMCWAF